LSILSEGVFISWKTEKHLTTEVHGVFRERKKKEGGRMLMMLAF